MSYAISLSGIDINYIFLAVENMKFRKGFCLVLSIDLLRNLKNEVA